MANYKINPTVAANQRATRENYYLDYDAKQIIDLRTGLPVLKTEGFFEEGDENKVCHLNSDVNDLDGISSELEGI
jgi:hypothetical protein